MLAELGLTFTGRKAANRISSLATDLTVSTEIFYRQRDWRA